MPIGLLLPLDGHRGERAQVHPAILPYPSAQPQFPAKAPEFIGDASDGLFHRPAIKHLKAATPEQDFAIEFAYHRWHLIQGMHEFVELLLLCTELRFVRFAVGDVTGDAV